jgi:hypothetical protein
MHKNALISLKNAGLNIQDSIKDGDFNRERWNRGLTFSVDGADGKAAIEFKGAVQVATAFHQSLGDGGKLFAGGDFSSRMALGVFGCMTKSPFEGMPRDYIGENHSLALRRMSVHKDHPLEGSWKLDMRLNWHAKDRTSRLVIWPFDPATAICKPRHATHFQVFRSLGIVSDYRYDAAKGMYEPTSSNSGLHIGTEFSGQFRLDAAIQTPITLSIEVPEEIKLDEHTQLVAGIGIHFFHWKARRVHATHDLGMMMVL